MADVQLGLATAPVLLSLDHTPELAELVDRRCQEPGDLEQAIAWVSHNIEAVCPKVCAACADHAVNGAGGRCRWSAAHRAAGSNVRIRLIARGACHGKSVVLMLATCVADTPEKRHLQ